MATDRIQAMRIFRRVAELGSFSAAANDLDMTPATVSKHIAHLEHHLGTRLIHRTTRRMHLSDSGQLYLDNVQRLLDDLDETELKIRGLDASPKGKLRINAPMSFGLTHLCHVVDDFRNTYPDMDIDLQLTDYVVDLVEQGVDIAIRVRNELPDSSLKARVLWQTYSTVCASPSYLDKHGWPQHPVDLQNHNCLVFSLSSSPTVWQLGSHRINIPDHYRINNSLAIRKSLLNHQGIALIPSFLVHEELRNGSLVSLLSDFPPNGHCVYAVFPPGRQTPRKARLFIEHLEAWIGTPPCWEHSPLP